MSQRNNPPKSREWKLTHLHVPAATNLDGGIQVLFHIFKLYSALLLIPKNTVDKKILEEKCNCGLKKIINTERNYGEKRDLDGNKLSQHNFGV